MSNIPSNPETIEDLKPRFERLKEDLAEQWADSGIATPPTDKDVWGQMRAIAMLRKDEALADDMEYYIFVHSNRIKLIDEVLKTLI